MRNAIASPCSATDFHTPIDGYEILGLNMLGARDYLLGVDVAIDYEAKRKARRDAVGASVTYEAIPPKVTISDITPNRATVLWGIGTAFAGVIGYLVTRRK